MTIRTGVPSSEYARGWDKIYNKDTVDRRPEIGYITTFTGKVVFFEDPDPESIDIRDIAHALSQQCRFAGHTRRFLSVAEHSILVSLQCGEYALEGLFHDASEAYMVDMPTPIKRKMSNYKDYENRLMKAIFTKFNLQYPLPQIVHDADTAQLVKEARALVTLSDWTDEYVLKMSGLEPYCIRSEDAETQFLRMFNKLMEARNAGNNSGGTATNRA